MTYVSKSLLAISIALPLAFSAYAKPIPDSASMDIHFELPAIQASMYARPYVAVWIEDQQRKSVRTVQLWVGKDEWLKDLRSWWRKVGRYDRELVDAVTSATRPAGEYRFSWDGLMMPVTGLSRGHISSMQRLFESMVVETISVRKFSLVSQT